MYIRQKTYYKRKNNAASRRIFLWAALFLAFSLTGCAAGDSGEENGSAYVFETQFHSPKGGVEDFTVFGDSVYYSTFDGEFYQWTPGGVVQKLDIASFTPEADGRILQADFQGNLYVFYHVPESQTNTDFAANYLVKYDADGKELARENISRLTRQFSPYETAVDAEGRIYLMGNDRLLQFDGACNYIGAAESPEEERLIWLAGDDRGHVYCCLSDDRTNRGIIREAAHGKKASIDDQSASPEGNQSTPLEDTQSAVPGDAPIAFMGNVVGEFQAGNHLAVYGENRFLTSMGNALYLYDAAAKTQTVLLQWANCDINPGSVQRLATLADGRILVNLQEEGGIGELALLAEVPREQAAQKDVITLGILQASNSYLLRCVSQFNRNFPDCRIEIREYYDALLDSGQPEAAKEARTKFWERVIFPI